MMGKRIMAKIFFSVFLIASMVFLGGCNGVLNKNLQKGSPSPMATAEEVVASPQVPLPSGEDVVRTFFNLIGEKRIPEAMGMMDSSMAPDEKAKQIWEANFKSLSSVSVNSIEPWEQEGCPCNRQTYKVTLNITVSPEGASAPIPYYGWNNGSNTRWVTIAKENNLWKMAEIATGP
jgi:hypothetical protein